MEDSDFKDLPEDPQVLFCQQLRSSYQGVNFIYKGCSKGHILAFYPEGYKHIYVTDFSTLAVVYPDNSFE
jgi:hypothetical protein